MQPSYQFSVNEKTIYTVFIIYCTFHRL